jgi:hypothetical protein
MVVTLLVNVTSVMPVPSVATMELPPVVPTRNEEEAALVTVYRFEILRTSATRTVVPAGNVVLSKTQ